MSFTHLDEHGNAKMVDISPKENQKRIAIATGQIFLRKDTIGKIKNNQIAKGNVLTVAQIAGINAAKKTYELIPLCHPLMLTDIEVNFEIEEDKITASCTTKSVGKTGVEMEALTGVACSLLTIYDMCKAVDKEMKMGEIKLVKKEKFSI